LHERLSSSSTGIAELVAQRRIVIDATKFDSNADSRLPAPADGEIVGACPLASAILRQSAA
jgi:hypothetical protein